MDYEISEDALLEAMTAALAASTLELKECRAAIENLQASRDALLASLSWRLTAPARRAARLMAFTRP